MVRGTHKSHGAVGGGAGGGRIGRWMMADGWMCEGGEEVPVHREVVMGEEVKDGD